MRTLFSLALLSMFLGNALAPQAMAQGGRDRGRGGGSGGPSGMMMSGPGGPGGGMMIGGTNGMMMMGGPGGPGGGMMMGGPGGPGGGMMGGGFDSFGFLARMDTNGNGMLDPDELQGPSRFFLDRIARNNPSIDVTKPIPISTITAEFERMRSGRGGDGGMGGGWQGWGSWGVDTEEGTVQNKSLVPGFGSSKQPAKVLGFGSDGEIFSVKVLEEDMREAEERLRRYDTNRDGFLDQNELTSGRFRDNPMQYDRNGDGKLSREELAVRYARIRVAGNSQSNQNSGNDGDRRRGGGGNNAMANSGGNAWGNWSGGQVPTAGGYGLLPASLPESAGEKRLWAERATYRPAEFKDGRRVQGLPSWFTDSDTNGDGQVSMKEFASSWNDTVIEKFLQFDVNQDGYITAKECLEATKKGILADRTASPIATTKSEGGTASGAATSTGGNSTSNRSTGSISREGLPPDAETRWVDWVEKRIIAADKNKNGFLSVDEWSASEGDFSAADQNRDGQISLAEYYMFKRGKK